MKLDLKQFDKSDFNPRRTHRLKELRDYIADLDLNTCRFNMYTYGEERSCGTIGCAAGYAALNPKFRKAGLHNSSSDFAPEYGDTCEEKAMALFLGIPWSISSALFLPEYGEYGLSQSKGSKARAKFLKNLDEVIKHVDSL